MIFGLFAGRNVATGNGRVAWAELREAQRSACGSRSALLLCVGLPAQAGSFHGWVSTPSRLRQREAVLHETLRSAPGGRGTFFVRTKKVPKESRPASTPHGRLCTACRLRRREACFAQPRLRPCAARNIGWLRNSALRASDSPRHRRYASEPDASALLGVSEGERKVSMINGCRILVARRLAEGRDPGDVLERLAATPDSVALQSGYAQRAGVVSWTVLTFGSRRERRVAERDREEGRGLSEHRAQRGRVPQAPGRASNAGESGALRLTANAGSPFLGYFFWRSKRSNTPAGCGNPANARLQTNNTNRQPHTTNRSVWALQRAAQPTAERWLPSKHSKSTRP